MSKKKSTTGKYIKFEEAGVEPVSKSVTSLSRRTYPTTIFVRFYTKSQNLSDLSVKNLCNMVANRSAEY